MTDRTATLARLLRADAEAQGLSGAEIARRAGLSQTGVAKILRGDAPPGIGPLLRILGALGRDLRWLHRAGITPPEKIPESSTTVLDTD